MGVDDMIIRVNPSNNILKELKKFHNFDTGHKYSHWYPIFAVMLCTSFRVGEETGLRCDDIDMKEGTFSVNHTLVYYNHAQGGYYFGTNKPKTEAGNRDVPMFGFVKDSFLQ